MSAQCILHLVKRAIRLDYKAPQPSESQPPATKAKEPSPESRADRFQRAQEKIAAMYAETFRRLAE